MQSLRVIMSGGGTGGHIFPAVAIANAIKKLVPHAEIIFIGAEGRMEMEKVPAAGYKIIGLKIAGFQRSFTLANFTLPFKIIGSMLKAKKIIADFKPNVVIGTGGYASGPTLKSANNKGIKTILQEQNSYPGITNKILSKNASRICVAYEGLEKFFPANKIMFTGNPVRQDIFGIETKKEEAYKYFGLDSSKKTILIIGGSLGARTINEAIGKKVKAFADEEIQIVWQTGKAYITTAKEQTAELNEKGIKAFDFISRMDLAYSIADLVISRAGASSISELSIVAKPCVLVPSPNVSEDHQTKNAMALVNKQAAILVKDKEADEKLVDETIKLINNSDLQNKLIENIKKLAIPNSAELIALEALRLAEYKL